MWVTTDRSLRPNAERSANAAVVRVVVVDNYDSFTHNLTHALALAGARCAVVRHDAATADALLEDRPDGFVLSAGPCTPAEAGVSVELVRALCSPAQPLPLLGVCLGHQVVAAVLGGEIQQAVRPIHGKLCAIRHDGESLFEGLPNPLQATCYNSLVVRQSSLPEQLVACAWNAAGELMGLRHRSLPIWGLQFHPESVLSRDGPALLSRWVEVVRAQTHGACTTQPPQAGYEPACVLDRQACGSPHSPSSPRARQP